MRLSELGEWLRSRGSVTALYLVAVLLFVASIRTSEGRYFEATACLAGSFLIWILSRQRMGDLHEFYAYVKSDLRDTGKLIVMLTLIIVGQLLLYFAPILLFSTEDAWSTFLITRSNEFSVAITIIGVGTIFGWTVVQNLHDRTELLRKFGGRATQISVLFIFLPAAFVPFTTFQLQVLGIALFLTSVTIYWFLKQARSLKQIMGLFLVSLLIIGAIDYGTGFTAPQSQELWKTMYVESAQGMRTIGASWRDLTLTLRRIGFAEHLPMLTDESGRRVAIDYQSFELTRQRFSELYQKLHRETVDATLHLEKAQIAAQELAHYSQGPVAFIAGRYDLAMRALSYHAKFIDCIVELSLLLYSSTLDQQAAEASLTSAQYLLTLVDEMEKSLQAAGLPTDDVRGRIEFTELVSSASVFRNHCRITGILSPCDGNHTLFVRLVYPSEVKIGEVSVYLLPETKWLIQDSVQTVETGQGIVALRATVNENNASSDDSYPWVLVVVVPVESNGYIWETPFIVPITPSSS